MTPASASPRIAAIGECMVELSDAGPGLLRQAYGGDTLNTAVYLSRLGARVSYFTALGDDPYSARMMDAWRDEGIDTSLVVRCQGRLPGLYMIDNDEHGDRQFYYWRSQAPVRELFHTRQAGALLSMLADYDCIYLSLITLSLFDRAQRVILLAGLDRARSRGCRVAFDSNYRPRGWSGSDAAREVMAEILPRVDIALPGLQDEQQLYPGSDTASCARRYRTAGAAEVAVKDGARGCWLDYRAHSVQVSTEPVLQPVDTTAAGDAFNAGYLAARFSAVEPVAAAATGHRLAAVVIRHRGAIIPIDAMPGPLPDTSGSTPEPC